MTEAFAQEVTQALVVQKAPSLLQKMMEFMTEAAVKYSFQVVGGLIILAVAWMLSKFVARMLGQALADKNIDITIQKFILQAVRVMVLGLGVLIALSSFGVQIAPLLAGLSVAGLGAGLALQGPLSNYAAGATLIFTKPFKVGDIIEVKGYQGEVTDIALPRTELAGLDGSIIAIPNKHIIGEVIRNFSHYRKLEINVGVAYDSDINKVIRILEEIIKEEKGVTATHKVGIKEFADSAINMQVMVWAPQDRYTDVKFDINKKILERFSANKISIPFPQRDVHLYQK